MTASGAGRASADAPGVAPRRRLTSEQRRQRVVEAAVAVFAERGYSGASVLDVARRAGITKATLYDHFPSKREMYLAVLRLQRDEALRQVLPRLGADLPPREAVANALDVFLDWAQQHPATWRLLFGETYGDGDLARQHRALQSEAYLAIAAVVLGVRRRGGRPSRHLQMVAEVLGGAVHGLARWWWHDHPGVPRRALVDALMDVLWVGLERLREDRAQGRQ